MVSDVEEGQQDQPAGQGPHLLHQEAALRLTERLTEWWRVVSSGHLTSSGYNGERERSDISSSSSSLQRSNQLAITPFSTLKPQGGSFFSDD